jgi:hypothetical protein
LNGGSENTILHFFLCLILCWYCTILINLAITGHRPLSHGQNPTLVPCPSEVGQLWQSI